jgi:hypothetical protein
MWPGGSRCSRIDCKDEHEEGGKTVENTSGDK